MVRRLVAVCRGRLWPRWGTERAAWPSTPCATTPSVADHRSGGVDGSALVTAARGRVLSRSLHQEHSKLVLERGAATLLEGRAFVEGCRDSMGCSTGLGCDACRYEDPPEVPLRDVSLRLVQADRTWDLAVADAGMAENNQLGWVTWTFEVPVGANPGPAKLVPEHGEGVRVEIG